jgi:uroporphyrinogen-III synthase
MNKTCQKTVWITRTLPSATDSAAAFEAAGFESVVAPLLTVETIKVEARLPQKSILIFTSQNGVRAFCEQHECRDFDVVTVGDATGQLARDMGFSQVSSANGTSDDIAPLIAQTPNSDAIYLHISGQHVRGTVSEDVVALGLRAERRIYYRSQPVSDLPDINLADIDIAVLFSPLAAKIYAHLMPRGSDIKCLSISPATHDALAAFKDDTALVAQAPTLESLIAAALATG